MWSQILGVRVWAALDAALCGSSDAESLVGAYLHPRPPVLLASVPLPRGPLLLEERPDPEG